jgi:hypothetical protein
VCEHCGEPLPAGLRSEARYCSKRCRQAASRARLSAEPNSTRKSSSLKRGKLQATSHKDDYRAQLLTTPPLAAKAIAAELGYHPVAVPQCARAHADRRRRRPQYPQKVPRFIPEPELEQLMPVIDAITCPFQRAALLVARWS